MTWLKRIFPISTVEYLPPDWCIDKTNIELIDKLKNECISPNSGNMIVLELLERLIKITEPQQ